MQRDTIVRPIGLHPNYDRIVVVQAKFSPHYRGDADEWGEVRAEGACVDAYNVVDSVPEYVSARYPGTATETWQCVLTAMGDAAYPLLLSYRCRDHLAALGFWSLVEHGGYELRSYDPADGPGVSRGLVILSDTPTVVCFGPPATELVVTWMDPANLGFSPTGMLLGGDLCRENHHALAEQVGRWISQYMRLLKSLKLNSLQHTAASQAMAGYLHSYMSGVVRCHKNPVVVSMERDALYGGRCESRHVGELYSQDAPAQVQEGDAVPRPVREHLGPLYHLDVNSLYPSVAREALLPVQLQAFARHVSLKTLHLCLDTTPCVATVTLETDRPILPYRLGEDIIYPVGRWTGTYVGPELRLLRDAGCIVQCHALAVYRGEPIYRRWVETLYAERLRRLDAGDTAMAKAIKLLLNSGFSKWAQRKRRWQDVTDMVPPAPYSQWWGDGGTRQYRAIGWCVQREEFFQGIDAEKPSNMVAITAYVNSLARVRLWQLMQIAHLEHVYYYDTDSLIVDEMGHTHLEAAGELHGTRLGAMSVRGRHGHVRIIGRQAYECDGMLTLSGTASPCIRDGESFAKVYRSPPIQHWLLKDEPPGIDRLVCRVRKDRPYRHGHVQADGSVEPVRIDRMLSHTD